MEKEIYCCPNDHGPLVLKKINKSMLFRGEDIDFQMDSYVCEKCGLETATIEQTAATQNAISDAYRKKMGLLSGSEIRNKRNKLGWSQSELAKRAGVGVAGIKRWENGIIQTKSINLVLKAVFENTRIANNYTGNRSLSIPRIKLVMKEFEKELGFRFLEECDMLLFDAKYLWYADMVGFHLNGKSLTGATYAALPHGPQLNNYKELVELIREADVTDAEPLSAEEKKIILRIALTFPTKQSIIDAAHREKIWENKHTGSTIPYSDSANLTEITV